MDDFFCILSIMMNQQKFEAKECKYGGEKKAEKLNR